MEERKQKKPVPLPLVVLVALLALLLLNSPQTNPKDQVERNLEKTTKECKKLLRREDYSSVTALFDSIDEYPRSQAEIKRQLKDHMRAAVKDMDVKRIPAIYNAFSDHDTLLAVVDDALVEAVDAMWTAPSYADFLILYQKLAQEGVYLKELDAYCMEMARYCLQTNGTRARFWIELLSYNEVYLEQLQSFADELMNTYLEQGEYDNAQFLFSDLEYVGLKRENAAAMFLEAAYALMDQGEYTYAEALLRELELTKQLIFDLQAKFTLRLAFQYIYIENGQFADAETYAMSFAGDTREKLMEVLLQHTADRGFIEAIEAVVLNRMDMEEAGTAPREVLDKELELLRLWQNQYFVDDEMKQLLIDYLNALTHQRKTTFWEQNAETAAYWQQMEDERLATLRTLARDYGFGEGDERLQSLLGQQ